MPSSSDIIPNYVPISANPIASYPTSILRSGLASMAESIGSGLSGGLTSAASGLLGGLVNLLGAKRQQKLQQQNMRLQTELQSQLMNQASANELSNFTQMFDMQNSRQDYLLNNQKQIEVNALRNAGLNPALAQGNTSLASTSSPTSSAPSGSVGLGGVSAPSFDGAASALLDAQREQLESSKQLNDASAAVALKKVDPEVAKIKAETIAAESKGKESIALAERYKTITPAEVQSIGAHVEKLGAETHQLWKNMEANYQAILASAFKDVSQANLNDRERTFIDAQERLAVATIAQVQAAAYELYSRANLNDSMSVDTFNSAVGRVIMNESSAYDLVQKESFDPETRAWLDVINNGADSFNKIAGGIGNFLPKVNLNFGKNASTINSTSRSSSVVHSQKYGSQPYPYGSPGNSYYGK